MQTFGKMLLATTLAFSLIGASPPLPVQNLAPSSPWNVDYDTESCKLRRGFGEGDGRIGMEITRFLPGDTFQLILFGKPLAGVSSASKVTITFGELPKQEQTRFAHGNDTSGEMVLIMGGVALRPLPVRRDSLSGVVPVAQVQPEEEVAVKTVTFSSKPTGTFVFETGSLGGAMAALRRCNAALIRSWGIDPDVQLRFNPVPINSPGRWVTDADYPRAARRDHRQALTSFRLLVDAKGVPSSCAIQLGLGGDEFRKITCDLLMKRARFKPALDRDGLPVAHYFLGRVNWAFH
jgi:Gram-negative bacterial TonB protein C-terminal